MVRTITQAVQHTHSGPVDNLRFDSTSGGSVSKILGSEPTESASKSDHPTLKETRPDDAECPLACACTLLSLCKDVGPGLSIVDSFALYVMQ